MDDDFLHIGSADIYTGNDSNGQDSSCQFFDDSDFVAAPGLHPDD